MPHGSHSLKGNIMHKLMRFTTALLLLILMLFSCAIADEAIPIPTYYYAPEAGLKTGETSNIYADKVDPIVPEEECLFGDEESGEMTVEADPANAEPGTPCFAEADDAGADAPASTKDTASSAQIICLGVGEKQSLPGIDNGGAWVYRTSNTKIASVSADGVIKGRKRGKAKVVMSDGETVIEYTVKVMKAPNSIKFTGKSLTLAYDAATGTGEQVQATVKLSSNSSSRITYYGYDRDIVSVSGDGIVTAVGTGATKLKARTFNKKKAEIRITVIDSTGESTPSTQGDQTRIVAHRGSAHWEENTLTAFRNFASTGADAVELDARSCLDGTQVIFHDSGFSLKGIHYKVEDLTVDQLRRLKPSICTLDEALDVIAETGKDVFLELKETADGAQCIRSVQNHGLESRTVFFSFNEETLKQVYSALPSAVLGLSLKASAKPYSAALLQKAEKLHVSFFMANKKLMTSDVVKYWKSKGYGVYVWTVNDKKTMRALNGMGVDGILTDYPEKCVQALTR